MGWYKPKTVKHTFEKLGYPELWVELKLPQSMAYGEAKEFQSMEADEESFKRILAKVVLGWNLKDPVTDKDLPLPSEDPNSVDALPIEFFMSIQEAFANAVEGAGPNPEKSSSSGAGS
jgi:hypothetical protein